MAAEHNQGYIILYFIFTHEVFQQRARHIMRKQVQEKQNVPKWKVTIERKRGRNQGKFYASEEKERKKIIILSSACVVQDLT